MGAQISHVFGGKANAEVRAHLPKTPSGAALACQPRWLFFQQLVQEGYLDSVRAVRDGHSQGERIVIHLLSPNKVRDCVLAVELEWSVSCVNSRVIQAGRRPSERATQLRLRVQRQVDVLPQAACPSHSYRTT